MKPDRKRRWWWRVALLVIPAACWCGYLASRDPFVHQVLLSMPGNAVTIRMCQSCLVVGGYPFVPDATHVFDPVDVTPPGQEEGIRVFHFSEGPRVLPEFDDYVRFCEGVDRAGRRGVSGVRWSDGAALALAFWLLLPLSHAAAIPLVVGVCRHRGESRANVEERKMGAD
ncbi:MAG: hypothetical protein JXO22_06930 [Phycisphaerae bacterium]|nr:hypothetical protein [Phycisphaerae bacterium]